jgi:DNA-binding transcriptional LysR family regulator
MELRHVRAFLVLAEEKHFGRAAVRLHVTQPAVSQAIRALEEEVGAQLFARTRRRVELTEAGVFFQEHAARALDDLERAAAEARRAGAGEIGRLRLAFTSVSALSGVPRVIAEFKRRYPDVQVSVQSLGTTAQIEAIQAGQCDVGFTVMPLEIAALRVEQVTREPLLVLVHAGHRLARRRSVGFADLAGEPVILMSRTAEPAIHAAYRRFCDAAGYAANIAFEVDHVETMLSFVAAGLGVSHAPAAIRELRYPGVVTVPIAPRKPAGVSAMWDPRAASKVTERFLEVLREERSHLREALA